VKRLLILGAVAYGTYRLLRGTREGADFGDAWDVDFGDEEAL
jgi:hypothetical protein